MTFKLWYKDNKLGKLSKDVVLTNCILEDQSDSSFLLSGSITDDSINQLIDVMYVNKGDDWNEKVDRSNFDGAYTATNEKTLIGYCETEQTTADGTKLNNCFMIKNHKLCNTPEPESIWIYKKCTKPMSFSEYMSL